MDWEVSFPLLCGGVGRRGRPLRGGWSHSPPVGEGGDVDDSVAVGGWWAMGGVFRMECLSGGEGGGRVCLCVSEIQSCKLFCRNVARDIG